MASFAAVRIGPEQGRRDTRREFSGRALMTTSPILRRSGKLLLAACFVAGFSAAPVELFKNLSFDGRPIPWTVFRRRNGCHGT